MNSQGDGKPTTLNKNRTTVKTFLLNILQTLVVAVGMTFIADNAAAQRKVAEPPARIKPANAAAADSLNPILAQQDTLRLLDSANKPLLSRNDSLQLRKDSIKIAKKRDWATVATQPQTRHVARTRAARSWSDIQPQVLETAYSIWWIRRLRIRTEMEQPDVSRLLTSLSRPHGRRP